MDPTKYEDRAQIFLDEKLKPRLQTVLDAILIEDEELREQKTIGDCLEYVLKHDILSELVAYGKSNKPEGLFIISIKFLTFVILDIQSTHILNHKEVHPAIMQMMAFIHTAIKSNMINLYADEG